MLVPLGIWDVFYTTDQSSHSFKGSVATCWLVVLVEEKPSLGFYPRLPPRRTFSSELSVHVSDLGYVAAATRHVKWQGGQAKPGKGELPSRTPPFIQAATGRCHLRQGGGSSHRNQGNQDTSSGLLPPPQVILICGKVIVKNK